MNHTAPRGSIVGTDFLVGDNNVFLRGSLKRLRGSIWRSSYSPVACSFNRNLRAFDADILLEVEMRKVAGLVFV